MKLRNKYLNFAQSSKSPNVVFNTKPLVAAQQCLDSQDVQNTDGFGNLWKNSCSLGILHFRYRISSRYINVWFWKKIDMVLVLTVQLFSGWTRGRAVSYCGTRMGWPPSGRATRNCIRWRHRCENGQWMGDGWMMDNGVRKLQETAKDEGTGRKYFF